MKTEAELLAAKKAKQQHEPQDPCPDYLFSVVYCQDSLLKSQSEKLGSLFSNVHGFADADFDMDIDCNFHESEALFFNKLGYTQLDEDTDQQ